MQTELNIESGDHVMMFANYIFDGSVWEIMMAHMNSAALYIPTNETIKDISVMKKYVQEKEISISYFPPAYFEQGEFELKKYIVNSVK